MARYGGEECIVLLANAALDDAHRVAELIRASVEALGVEHTSSSAANMLTLGLALVSLVPSDQIELSGSAEAADTRLYKAKKSARNRGMMSQL